MLVAPEQLTMEDESRNAEDTDLVGLLYDTVVIRLTIAGEIVLESRTVATGFRNQAGHRVRVVDIQFTLPEAVENEIVISLEETFAIGKQRAYMRCPGIEDTRRPLDHQILAGVLGETSRIHIEIAGPSPLMLVACAPDDFALPVNFDRAEKPAHHKPVVPASPFDDKVGEPVPGFNLNVNCPSKGPVE